ncbi:hypothetical protein D9753_35015 [Streptomyces dangxiongensis]|uniref:Uncharacterized protein n=1 Tax=Streptomyces dangxiongensis TaxID=1442032 RepID=A0A3G2JP64_9ACTN|nr:hypothetical protein [Streptomyces dangxiongensis]AYN43235.1 hypothetical protein D9753_35015 [Streptomyces dangxiongensis]
MIPGGREGTGTAGRKRPWLAPRTRSAPPAERHPAPPAELAARRVGGAWLIHPATGPDRRSLLFAAGLAADPEHSVVVVDLPPETALDAVEKAVARAVPAGPRGLRLVFGRPPAQGPAAAGRWLAGRLGQDVVVPDGVLLPSAGGALFIGADRGRGWVLCTPEGRERYVSRRFPRPAWDEALPDRPWPVGASAVAEPVNTGVWLRPAREDAAQHRHRRYLAARLRGRSDAATVVIGTPDAPEPSPEDVARFWQDLPEDARTTMRVVLFGQARTPGGRPFGETLAALTGEPVHAYNGFPTSDPVVGRAPLDEVLFLERDGTPGRPVFAREYLHLPPEPGGPSDPLLAVDHRWPLDHLPMLRRGLYRGSSGVMLEVLPWGLWIRPSVEPSYADEVRAAPPDPHHELILCDDSVPEALPRSQQLAEDVVRRLPPESGLLVRVLTAGRPWGVPAARPGAAAPPRVPDEPSPAAGESSSEEAGTRPERPAGGPFSGAGSPKDTAVVALALRRNPELGRDQTAEAVLTGLVAVRVQLTVHGRRTDHEHGDPGGELPPPTAPALAGLALLPPHDGVVALRADLTEAETRWYDAHRQVIEHGACSASLAGHPGRAGNTDIVIRSVTGRRTALLEPEVPDRVLFAPGARFEVLEVRVRRGERTVVLMRELPAWYPESTPVRTVVKELEVALRVWRADEESGLVRGGTPDPFARPPGLGSPAPAPEGSGAADRPAGLSERFR